MNSATAVKHPPAELLLTIMSGEDKGVSYKLLGETISLGRAPENDVVINDHKASRNHARLERRPEGCWIKDLESRVGILLNGRPVTESVLKDGDIIRIGDTNIRFGPAPGMTIVSSPPVPLMPPNIPSVPSSRPQPTTAPKSMFTPPKSEGKNPFIIIIVIGLVISGALLTRNQISKGKHIQIKDESAYDQQIEGTNQFNQNQEQVILEKGKDTQQYAEAQGFYLRGFREFRDENYGRAIQDFEAALALYPNHPLAKRYLDRSRLKLNEVITQALERGERDFQNEKYMNAFNEYRTVILLTNDPKNKNFELAQKRIETIQLILTNNR
jgi:pSer/pThr/pTyr-binding forkhead associated (FHA) protein